MLRRGSVEPRRSFLFEENEIDYFFFFLVAFLTAFFTAFLTAFFLAAMCIPPSRSDTTPSVETFGSRRLKSRRCAPFNINARNHSTIATAYRGHQLRLRERFHPRTMQHSVATTALAKI